MLRTLQALVAADQGMADLVDIAKQSKRCLMTGGWLWMEHGYRQADSVQTLLKDLGFARIQSILDLDGIGESPEVKHERFAARSIFPPDSDGSVGH